MTPQTPRALALSLLLRSEQDNLYSNLILDTAIRRNRLRPETLVGCAVAVFRI